MFETRKDAIAAVAARPALKSGDAVPFDLETYASDVFGIDCMRERLPKGVFQKLYKTITEKSPLDPTIADDVANAMKRWAIEKSCCNVIRRKAKSCSQSNIISTIHFLQSG